MSTGPINYNSAIRYPEGCPVIYNGWICKVVCHKEQYTRRIEQIKPVPGSPLIRVNNSELGRVLEVKVQDLEFYIPEKITPTATVRKKSNLIGLS